LNVREEREQVTTFQPKQAPFKSILKNRTNTSGFFDAISQGNEHEVLDLSIQTSEKKAIKKKESFDYRPEMRI